MTLILLHGGGLGPWSWRRHLEQLPADCHVPVLPGHRGSDVELYSMERAVTDVVRLAESCPAPVVLAGLSLGGQVAVAAAARRPDLVRAVVASGVNVTGIPMVGALTASLRLMKPLLKARPVVRASARRMGVPDDDVEQMCDDAQANGPRQLAAIYQASSAVRMPAGLPAERVLVLAAFPPLTSSPAPSSATAPESASSTSPARRRTAASGRSPTPSWPGAPARSPQGSTRSASESASAWRSSRRTARGCSSSSTASARPAGCWCP